MIGKLYIKFRSSIYNFLSKPQVYPNFLAVRLAAVISLQYAGESYTSINLSAETFTEIVPNRTMHRSIEFTLIRRIFQTLGVCISRYRQGTSDQSNHISRQGQGQGLNEA